MEIVSTEWLINKVSIGELKLCAPHDGTCEVYSSLKIDGYEYNLYARSVYG